MARPQNKGVDYFPMDVDFLSDLKVRRILKACGVSSITVLLYLLSVIYKDEGYYIQWDDDIAFLAADNLYMDEELVLDVVREALRVGFFSQKMFDKHQILTSKGIQERYIAATTRRKDVEIAKKYSLLNPDNVDNNSDNVCNNPDNVDNNSKNVSKSTQSKVKKSKVNKSKVNNPPTPLTGGESDDGFDRFWDAYPRKVVKKTTRKAWDKLKPDIDTVEEIVSGVERWKKTPQWQNIQYIPHPTTFLSQERWREVDDSPPSCRAAPDYSKDKDFFDEEVKDGD